MLLSRLLIAVILISSSSLLYAQQDVPDYEVYEVEYEWIDIEDVSNQLDLTNDDYSGSLEIGFFFPYFGEIYSEFYVSSNGFVGFNDPTGYRSYNNVSLPNTNYPNNIVAALWTNLNPETIWTEGEIRTGIRDGLRIIDFIDVGEQNLQGRHPGNTITFQIILHPSGDILVNYARIGEDFNLDDVTVGVEDARGTQGLTAYYNGQGIDIGAETAIVMKNHTPGAFLVWDAGSVTPSGAAQAEALETLGHVVDYLVLENGDELPADLGDYEAVFVNLGNYGVNGVNYHPLEAGEGEILAAYLDAGGNLYLEGGDTWFDDEATDVHPYFNIDGRSDGGNLATPVKGIVNGFARGLKFESYQAPTRSYIDHIRTVNGSRSEMTFVEREQTYIGMISYSSEVYKTIGCAFEFGGLVDDEPHTKLFLMRRMVDFFRTIPPEFPSPVNFSVMPGDEEMQLKWQSPAEAARIWDEEVRLRHELAQLANVRQTTKPSPDEQAEMIDLMTQFQEVHLADAMRRDELDGYNVYLDEDRWDYTNSDQYTVIELENGVAYSFGISAVYENPDAESDIVGPITAVPSAPIQPEYEQDFEEGNGSFHAQPSQDGWEWGEVDIDPPSGTHVWCTGLDGEYPSWTTMSLYMPVIDLSESGGWLTFKHYYDLEEGFDGGRLELSVDAGERWTILEPNNGYPEETVFALGGNPGFSGESDGWQSVNFDLSEYQGERLLLRFVMKSDFSISGEGWYIDDVVVTTPSFGSLRFLVSEYGAGSLPNATVAVFEAESDQLIGTTVSGPDGNTPIITDIPAGEYYVIASAVGYSDWTEEGINVFEGIEGYIPLELDRWASDIVVEPNAVESVLEYGEAAEHEVTITNDDEAPTEFYIYANYDFGEELPSWRNELPLFGDPWEQLTTIDLTAQTGEHYFTGATFVHMPSAADNQLIVSAGAHNSGQQRFYSFSRSGEYIGEILQDLPNAAPAWGLRDLTFDGRYIYGSFDAGINKMELYELGNDRESDRIGHDLDDIHLLDVCRAVAYVPEYDAFWIGDGDDNWFFVDRDGEVLNTIYDHGLTGVVGMAWNPADPDGANLYIHNQEIDGSAALYRYSFENGEVERMLTTAEEGEGQAGGAFVTHYYDTYNYTLGVVIQGAAGDLVKLYALHPFDSWLEVETISGELDGEANLVNTLTLSSGERINFLDSVLLEIHDMQRGEVTQLMVSMEVGGGAAFVNGVLTLVGGDGDPEEVDLTLTDVNDPYKRYRTNPDYNEENDVYEYAFNWLMSATYRLSAELDGYVSFLSEDLPLDPYERLEDFDISLSPPAMGLLAGTVTTADGGEIVDAADVAVIMDDQGSIELVVTDEYGEYELELPVGTYSVGISKDLWGRIVYHNVEISEDELTTLDVVMDDRLQVRSLVVDGEYDDKIVLNWLPPGTLGEPKLLSYDTGNLTDGLRMVNRTDIAANRFDIEGEYDIVNLSIYIPTRGDIEQVWGGINNGSNNEFFISVFTEDAEAHIPDMRLLEKAVFSHNENDELVNFGLGRGWTYIPIDDLEYLNGPVYVGFMQDPDYDLPDSRFEYIGLDEDRNHDGVCYLKIDGEWQPYDNLPGDMMIRMVIYDHFTEEVIEYEAGNRRSIRRATNRSDMQIDDIVLANPAYRSPSPTRYNPDWTSIYQNIPTIRRDGLSVYNVYINDELAVADLEENSYEIVSDSENENVPHTVKIVSIFDDENATEVESAEFVALHNMAPAPVRGVYASNDGLDYTIEWGNPDEHANGDEPLTDLAGCDVYIEDELVASVDSQTEAYDGSLQPGEEGWYDVKIIAYDEVPNYSDPVTVRVPLGESKYYSFDAGGFNQPVVASPNNGWQRSLSSLYGPGGAHSPVYYWATRPTDDHVGNNAAYSLTTKIQYEVELQNAQLEFYHYINSETDRDGGQVRISVDEGDWQMIEPNGEYSSQHVLAFQNYPAYTGRTEGWQLESFDLSDYIGHRIRVQWLFKSDATQDWYPGWYIDDVVLWGCSEARLGELYGYVQDDQGNYLRGVTVTLDNRTDLSSGDGYYEFKEIVPGLYDVSAEATGYGAQIINDIQIFANEDVNQDFELFRPVFTLSGDELDVLMGPAEVAGFQMQLTNETDQDVDFRWRVIAQREEEEGAGGHFRRDDRGDYHFDLNLSNEIGYAQLLGAVFTGTDFFITAYDSRFGAALYRLDRNGEEIDSYSQPINLQGWGLRDLAWDGIYLYASQGRNIVCFDEEANLIETLSGAPLTVNRALTYDPTDGTFWAGEWDYPIYQIDRDGNVLQQWSDHGLEGIFGFAWYEDDPDGKKLYIQNRENDGRTVVYRVDLELRELEEAFQLSGDGAGAFVTRLWDEQLWIYGSLRKDDVWWLSGIELESRVGWLSVEPRAGVLQAGSSEEVLITINLPAEAAAGEILEPLLQLDSHGGTIEEYSLEIEIFDGFRHFEMPDLSENPMRMRIEEIVIDNYEFSHGSEIAAYTPRGELGGLVRWGKHAVDLFLHGGDGQFALGDSIEILLWDADMNVESRCEIEFTEGNQIFIPDGYATVNLSAYIIDEQTITLTHGWNLISSILTPFNPSHRFIMSELIANDNLLFMRDQEGRFWWVRYGYNGMLNWEDLQAYYVKVAQDTEITLKGELIDPETEIHLRDGWSTLAYILSEPVDAQVALSQIMDEIVIFKDGRGRFIVPEFDFYGLGDLLPGNGYSILLDEEVSFTYDPGVGQIGISPELTALGQTPAPSPTNMSLLIPSIQGFVAGGVMRLEVVDAVSQVTAGSTEIQELPCGVIVFSDDTLTTEIEGASPGHSLELRLIYDDRAFSPKHHLLRGQLQYQNDGLTILDLDASEALLPEVFTVQDAYPNPFNSRIQVSFGLKDAARVSLSLFDMNGRKVLTQDNGYISAGWHRVNVSGETLPSGVYILQVESGEMAISQKIALIR
ncbi:carboxypeptidase regulatory-like domain-containing protein [Calditrichota bacterium]